MSSQKTLERMFTETLVKDVMTKALVSVDPATTLNQISKMMAQGGMGSILVKKDGTPSGIITDRDFAIKVAAKGVSLDTPVDQIASFPLETINANDSILNAAKIMSNKKIRKLAVSEDEKIVGIITSTDLVNQLAAKD
ncbi:MAG: CBS domain-containing protein [Nitrosopumilaceae archaeon]|jgi:signal-transduction protein with cAMP-binding, CBS, and nucleotidyltransferase domain